MVAHGKEACWEFTRSTPDFPQAILEAKAETADKRPNGAVMVAEKNPIRGLLDVHLRAKAQYQYEQLSDSEQWKMEQNLHRALMKVFKTAQPNIVGVVPMSGDKPGTELWEELHNFYDRNVKATKAAKTEALQDLSRKPLKEGETFQDWTL